LRLRARREPLNHSNKRVPVSLCHGLACFLYPLPCSVASRNHQLNRKQLRSALPAPSSGGDEDFASIGIFDFGSGGEAANIDITGVGRIRTNHESRFV